MGNKKLEAMKEMLLLERFMDSMLEDEALGVLQELSSKRNVVLKFKTLEIYPSDLLEEDWKTCLKFG
jgi:hypothetical protein